jgi:hypothetical protein
MWQLQRSSGTTTSTPKREAIEAMVHSAEAKLVTH